MPVCRLLAHPQLARVVAQKWAERQRDMKEKPIDKITAKLGFVETETTTE